MGRPRRAGDGKPAGTAESPVSNDGALPLRGGKAMNDSEWRLKLDAARKRLAAAFQEEFFAQAEAHVLHVLSEMERDYIQICQSLLKELDVAHDQLLANPQAEAAPGAIGFDVLATEVRRGVRQDTGLECARSKRDAARETAGELNIEFLIRAWLEWRLKALQDNQ